MPTVTAWQHIYSNVEASDSPSGKGGFQTLFYSREGLSQEDVRHIEKRVFYLPGDAKPTKRIFFTLPEGHVVLGAVVPLEGRDSAGRTGRHLAHCFIIPRSTFEAHPYNVVAFLRSASFYTTLEEVFQNGDATTGNMPAKRIQVIAPSEARSSRWNVEDMLRLLHMAYQAESRAKNGKSLAFIGSTELIEETLMAALTMLPNPLLPWCSFDTVFQNGGNIRHTYYWATGLDRSPRQQTMTTVDVTASSLAQSIPVDQRSVYEQWAVETASDGGIDRVVAFKEQAYPLCKYIEGTGAAPNDTPDWITERLVVLGATVINRRLKDHINQALPPELATHIFETVYNRLSTGQKLRSLETGFNVTDLLPVLYQHYAQASFDRPDRSERAILEDVLAGYPHDFLSMILAIWNNDMDELSARLDRLNERQYADFVQNVLPYNIVKHKELLRPQFAGVLLESIISTTSLERKEIISLAKEFIEEGAEKELDGFVRLLPALNKKDLKTLKKLTSKLSTETVLLEEIETLLNLEENNQGGLFNIFKSR